MPRRLIVVSGAGLSADSGVRTFRTDTDSGKALWDEYDLAEVCDIGAFQAGYRRRTSPDVPVVGGIDDDGMDLYEKTNNFYNKRRVELATVEPNAAHLQIAKWFAMAPERVYNITTNVDDLLERAGVARESVLHVHGYLPEIRYRLEPSSQETLVDVGYAHVDIDAFHWVKPNVVFFGEAAPLYNDMYALFDTLTGQDMVIVVGCSNQVINFNWELFPALNMGTKMIVVNPGLNYLEQNLYEERGVVVYYAGAAETFSNAHFIKMVEDHLNG
ncbi:NAD-dependent protein deacylase [Klebsiella phage KP13-26]|nr:NAD-dependent protein deacylase [Klebsiella phage KP13-26]